MSNSATPERSLPPRPVFETLPDAVKAALDHGNFQVHKMNLDRWAETYGCGVEDVRQAFEAEQSKRSLTPPKYEEFDK